MKEWSLEMHDLNNNMEDDTTDDLEIDDTIVDEAERESVVVSRSPSEAALCDDRDNPSGDDGDVTNQNGKVTAVEENLDEMDVDVCEANKENTSDPATKDGEADVVVSTTVAANDAASGSGEVTNNLDGEDIQDESDDKSLDKSKKKNSKGPAYSALNRRINGALQTTKGKVEEFQEKYGGEPDYILIMRDNMTEINDTGRPSIYMRVIVRLFIHFLYPSKLMDSKGYNNKYRSVLTSNWKLEAILIGFE